MEVEVVEALTLDGYTVISGHFAAGAGRLKGKLAYSTALLVFDVPLPCGDSVP